MTKHISCDCKCNSITYNLNQKWKKIIAIARKIVVGILAHVFVRIAIISDCVWWNYICYGFCINKKKNTVVMVFLAIL